MEATRAQSGKAWRALFASLLLIPASAADGVVIWRIDAVMTELSDCSFLCGPPSPTSLAPFTAAGIVVGSPITVTLAFDPDTPDTFPDPEVGIYPGAILSASVELGTLDPLGLSGMSQIGTRPSAHEQTFRFYFDSPAETDLIPNPLFSVGTLRIVDESGSDVNGDAIDPTLPDLAQAQAFLGLTFSGDPFELILQANVTSITVVPEPGTGVLLGLGLLGLGAIRAGRPRRS